MTLHLASFASKLVKHPSNGEDPRKFDNRLDFANTVRRRNDDLHKVFNDSVWLECLTNLDAKGARIKRSRMGLKFL